MNIMFSGLIGALIGALATAVGGLMSFKSSIHEESGWREKLLVLSQKHNVKQKHLVQLQSFVNPVSKAENAQECRNLDMLINFFCSKKLKEYTNGSSLKLEDSDKFRVLCRALLKHDWINQTGFFITKET